MSWFGDGRDERMSALDMEMRLKRNPAVTARREAYNASVRAARAHAGAMTEAEIIDALIRNNPAYIRGLLETKNERHGPGALEDLFARTFFGDFSATG